MTSTRSDTVMPNLSLLAKDGPTCLEVPSRPESEFAFIWALPALPALPAFPALPTPTSCLELGARRGLSVGQSADGEDTWWPWAALGGGVRGSGWFQDSSIVDSVDSMPEPALGVGQFRQASAVPKFWQSSIRVLKCFE